MAYAELSEPASILIVDDEAFVRVLLNDLSQEAGFVVHDAVTAADAEDVLQAEEIALLYENKKPECDK